jgi:hypothetical protein
MAHHPNFFEVLILKPKEGVNFADPSVVEDFQWVVDALTAGKGGVNFKIRKAVGNPDVFTLVASWATIDDHNDLDVQGVTAKLLKVLWSRSFPASAYFFYTDSSKVPFEEPESRIDAFHVKSGQKDAFGKELETRSRLVGGWYVTKDLPPLPAVMPTDPGELLMVEEGMKRAEARLREPIPSIWISFSTHQSEAAVTEFGKKVEEIVEKIDSGKYEKFLTG